MLRVVVQEYDLAQELFVPKKKVGPLIKKKPGWQTPEVVKPSKAKKKA